MNIIVSRSHVHISSVTMISWRWDTKCGASTNRKSAGFDLVGLKSRRCRGFTAGRTWFRTRTVATENSRYVTQFDFWILCMLSSILISSDRFSSNSITFPIYNFSSFHLTQFFSRIVLRIQSLVEPQHMLFNVIWDAKYHTYTNQFKYCKLFCIFYFFSFPFCAKSKELWSKWTKDAKTVIRSIFHVLQIFIILKSYECSRLRIQFPPNS